MHRIFFVLATGALAWAVDDTETIRQSYAAAPKLEVRNINGSVRVTGSSTGGIQLVATKKIHADDQRALDQARTEVRLDARPSGDVLRICVIQPWEDCSGSKNQYRKDSGCRGRDCDPDFWVTFDLELQVPTNIVLDLKTVNGSVSAKNTQGDFDAKTVNGTVTVEDINGSGTAHTVNGQVKLSFSASPRQSVDAKTVNGSIEAAFPKNMNGELRFKTFHGDVFTNFPTTAMVNEAPLTERRNGRTVVRSNRAFGVRVGSGGPEHHFETLNGSIEIKER